MKDERMEILKMLHEGLISVEDAEKLLAALSSGDEKSKNENNHKKHNHKSSVPDFWGTGFFNELDKGLSGIGKVVEGVFGNLNNLRTDSGYETIRSQNDSFPSNPGDQLFIEQRISTGFSGSSDLEISSHIAQNIEIEADGNNSYEVKRKDNNILIICNDDCSITIPDNLEGLNVKLINGDMEIRDITCPINCETLNGEISMESCSSAKYLKSLSGDIEMSVNPEFSGTCEVSTLSGDLSINIPEDFSGVIDAKAMSGEIECHIDTEISIIKEGDVLHEKQRIEIRSGEIENHIICSTLSGDIEIESV